MEDGEETGCSPGEHPEKQKTPDAIVGNMVGSI